MIKLPNYLKEMSKSALGLMKRNKKRHIAGFFSKTNHEAHSTQSTKTQITHSKGVRL